MHWLKAWREAHGIEREDFARLVEVSEPLIAILENQNGITHPLIADTIADCTGATSAQRDSLVHKKHHGTYKPNPRHSAEKLQKRRLKKTTPANTRAIVALNIAGDIDGIYDSADDAAAAHAPCSVRSVLNRCERKMGEKTDEFYPYFVTFRFLDEWSCMTQDQRDVDMAQAAYSSKYLKGRRKTNVKQNMQSNQQA